ncbi:hypothetical protein BASA60_003757 [Batrachochytrium salamandrivorans]|nr:hypothetical protein BASA60_003757 [Batrachochytrium salamandrivorans]
MQRTGTSWHCKPSLPYGMPCYNTHAYAYIQARILSRYQISLGTGQSFVGRDSHPGTHSKGNSRYRHANLYGSTVQHTEKLANGDTASSASCSGLGWYQKQPSHNPQSSGSQQYWTACSCAHHTAVLQDVPFLINMSADLPQTALHALPVIVPLNSNMALVSEEDIELACLFELVTAEAEIACASRQTCRQSILLGSSCCP